VGIDSVLKTNYANYHHSMGSLSASGPDSTEGYQEVWDN